MTSCLETIKVFSDDLFQTLGHLLRSKAIESTIKPASPRKQAFPREIWQLGDLGQKLAAFIATDKTDKGLVEASDRLNACVRVIQPMIRQSHSRRGLHQPFLVHA
jgi:hypothetical protein